MANKKWYQNLIPSRVSPEVKSLQARLDAVVGEFEDVNSYEAKFYDAEPSSFSGGGMTELAGVDQIVNAMALQRIFVTETWVYVAVMAIAKTIAGLPIKGEKKTKVTRAVVNDITLQTENVTQEIWVDSSAEKIFNRFNYPNEFTSREEFIMLLVIDLLTCGQFFVWLDSTVDLSSVSDATNGDANSPFARLQTIMASDTPIKGMYRIPPSLVKPMPSESGLGVEVYALESDKGTFAFHPSEMVHVKLPNPANQFEGLSPLIPSFKAVLLDRFSTEHIIRFYKSGARLGGVIQTEKTLNKEQLGRFQRSFENNYTGRQNHHRTLILPPGMKYQTIEQNPAETALLEFCKYNREAILSTYNVPPIKVGIMDHANYANALVQLKVFFEDTIKPLLSFIEGGFNLKNTVFPSSHTFRIKFDLSQIEALKENFKEKAEAAKFMIDSGLTINEVRKQVWSVGPIKDGDKCKVIEDIKNKTSDGGGPLFLAAPADGVATKTPVDQADAAAIASDINPTKTDFNTRVHQLITEYMGKGDTLAVALPKAIAQALSEGLSPDDDDEPPTGGNPNQSPDEAAAPKPDAEKLDTSTNSAWVPTAIGEGKPKKPKEEDEDEEKKEKPSLEAFISDALGKLNDDEPVTAEFIAELMEVYKQQYGETVEAKESEISTTEAAVEAKDTATPDQIQERQVYAFGLKKEQVVTHWKSFIGKTDPLIEKRKEGLQKFFKQMQSLIMNRLGSNLKAYGMHKSRDSDDADDITKLEGMDDLIKSYISQVEKELLEAYQFGYADTLATFQFTPPNEKAKAALAQYGADKVKGIIDTTREQLKTLLVEAFDEGVAVTEVSQRIRDKFAEMSDGRANTIARTETLTAVSMGREEKRQDWQQEFPDTPLSKMWVSAQDDKVRDTHQDYDGQVVGADEEFAEGLKFPRDPDCADPAEVINCRCTDITFAGEDQSLIEDTLPKTEDNSDEQE